MGASASLQQSDVTVAPGSEAAVELRVRNTGTVVDQFTFQAIGISEGYIGVEPPQVSLFPGAEETVRVIVRPPRASTTLAGSNPFAIKVVSREDPEGSVVEEGVLTIEPFDDRFAELVPRTSRGCARKGEHQLAFDNRGNAPSNATITGLDPDGQLTFDVDPPGVKAEPGTAAFTDVTVKPVKRFWKGVPVTKMFKVIVEEEGKEPITVDGAFLQTPMLPKWFWKALLALLAILLILLILWFTLLKPSIESTANDAAAKQVDPVVSAVEAAGIPVVSAPGGGPPPTQSGGEPPATQPCGPPACAGGGGGDSTVPGGGDTTTTSLGGGGGGSGFGDATDFRLTASATVGGGPGTPSSRTIPQGETFALTDIVLQNPNGDSGQIVIARDANQLFVSSLENFRDLDYHFVAPYLFEAGQNLTVQITSCTASGLAGGNTCNAAVSFSGFTSTT